MFGMTINIEEHKQTELTLLKNREELNHLIRQNEMVLNNANSGLAYISTDYIVQWENISMCSASLSHKAYRKGTICYQAPAAHVALRKLRHAAFDALASDGTGQIHVRQRTYGRSIRNSRIQKRPDDRRSRSPHRRRDRTRTDDQRTETGQSAR